MPSDERLIYDRFSTVQNSSGMSWLSWQFDALYWQ